MGGEEALTHFRRIKPDVPVILTSGHTEADAMRGIEARKVEAFLQKPFTAEQLGGTLREVLRKKLRVVKKKKLEAIGDR